MPHRLFILRSCSIVAVALAAVACKPKAAEQTPAESPASGEKKAAATEPGAPGVPWAEKTHQQKMEFMGIYVLPKMSALFKEHDAERFKDFKCQTCHGDDMESVDFHMPNDLYPLPTANTIEAAKEYDPEMTAFMMEKVVPTMVELLGVEPYDPATGKGFGCFSCHPTEG
ncbi:MAG: hypothetical protein D6705_15660 [Deltaproteobacteria bacterium]|nr:MAG: hypothetical protein D6705_15660 [Deltaproteobacteria bacterium]